MKKKHLLFVIGMCVLSANIIADEIANTFMLINNYNVRQSQTIWQRMRSGFMLDHSENKLVRYYEKMYSKNPRAFARILAAASPYLYYILTVTERNGIPSEVALIPIIESSFNAKAKTRANSVGLWQFMNFSGARFNLAQNSDIDERMNVVKSTNAAITYLCYLHRMFGQWDLAIGAYNWGEGNMYRSVRKSGQPLGQVDYSSLDLREVTEQYVPKLIALANIIENPKKFGITLEEYPNQPYFAIIKPNSRNSIDQFSALSGLSTSDFMALNTQFIDSDYTLNSNDMVLLPIRNQNIYYASIGQNLVNQNNVVIAANTNNTEPNTNPVSDSHIIPTSNNESELDGLIQNLALNDKESISNVNVVNDEINQEVAADADPSPAKTQNETPIQPVKYEVKNGDTMYSIARKFNTSVEEIQRINGVPDNNLIVGQDLIIKQ